MQQANSTDPTALRSDVDRVTAILRARKGRLTSERIALLHAICDMEGHFRPEDVAARMRERGHRVSVVTVYRSLPLLIEAGIVRRACLAEEEGGAIFEHVWGHEHHDHLVCMRCGRTVEFSYPAIEVLQDAVARQHGFELARHHMELVGTCAECRGEGGG